MSSELFNTSGIHGITGKPLVPSLSFDDFAGYIFEEYKAISDSRKHHLHALYEKYCEKVLGVREGYVEEDVADVGWGVIYSPNIDHAVCNVLKDLVDYRKGKKLVDYTPGVSAYDYRMHYGQGHGNTDPKKIPYYLLLVGSPAEIPFDFQYDLDLEHGVGRICFESVEEYRHYIDSIMAYEDTAKTGREKLAAFFSPTHTGENVIRQTADSLVTPLKEMVEGKTLKTMTGDMIYYRTEHKYGNAATRSALLDLLTRSTHKPSLLFTATHGVGFDCCDSAQRHDQGAILAQEWDGEDSEAGEAPEHMYLSGRHIPKEADFEGFITFAFSCYSAGVPKIETFARYYKRLPLQLAETPFISYLPQRLLAQGALAFIGHVDQTWSYSYAWENTGFFTETFEDALKAILAGKPVGYALKFFNERYLDLNNHLTKQHGWLDQYAEEESVEKEVVGVWTARNDARTYIVFGDPAVRLRPEIMSTS